MSDKAEWERLLDDSFQWHVAHRVMFVVMIFILTMAILVEVRYLALILVVTPFHVGFVIKENAMIQKSMRLRKQEQ